MKVDAEFPWVSVREIRSDQLIEAEFRKFVPNQRTILDALPEVLDLGEQTPGAKFGSVESLAHLFFASDQGVEFNSQLFKRFWGGHARGGTPLKLQSDRRADHEDQDDE